MNTLKLTEAEAARMEAISQAFKGIVALETGDTDAAANHFRCAINWASEIR